MNETNRIRKLYIQVIASHSRLRNKNTRTTNQTHLQNKDCLAPEATVLFELFYFYFTLTLGFVQIKCVKHLNWNSFVPFDQCVIIIISHTLPQTG